MERRIAVQVVRCAEPDKCRVAGACMRNGLVPCVELADAHAAKLQLCRDLEAVADAIPARIDRLLCLRIAETLVPQIRASHRYEEDYVFPAFLEGGEGDASAASIRRLEAEHVEDECAAQDLTDMLLAIGHGGRVENPEALGFMLRAFFETLRRHIAFEREHLLPGTVASREG